MKKLVFQTRSIPLALFILCLISYGLMIPWLGFYWDDWPYIWFAHTYGPAGLMKALAGDRPFLAAIYMFTTTVLGKTPLPWQIFAIVSRWLSAWVMWWTLKKIWPKASRQTALAAFLFAVYPGFGQHWISVIYSQAYLLLAASVVSLGLMVQSVRKPRYYVWFTLLALLTSLFSLLSTEYFFGMEVTRPLLLWFVLAGQIPTIRKRISRTLLYWAPYLVELVGFWVWRTFYFQSDLYAVQVLGQESALGLPAVLLNFIQSILQNSAMGGWQAWGQTFGAPNILEFQTRTTQLYWLVLLVSGALAIFYLIRVQFAAEAPDPADQPGPTAWSWQAILVGVVALTAATIPFWAAGLSFGMDFPWDRFTLATMMGSCLILVGLIDLLVRTEQQKIVLVGLLIALAVGQHFQKANTFRRDWDNMREFFWQVTWRMPGIQPNTMLLTHEFPFKYYSDNSLSAPLNWIYAPDLKSEQIPYILNFAKVRYKTPALPSFKPNEPTDQDYRAAHFYGNTSDSIVISYTLPGCLRVLDPIYTNETTLPELTYWLKMAIPLSNLNRIMTAPEKATTPPSALFGSEPAHTWCYYFEKAELARQSSDWETIANLGREAEEAGFGPQSPSEQLPFIEAYARTGDWKKAWKVTDEVSSKASQYQPALCQLWNRLETDLKPDPESQAGRSIRYTYAQILCKAAPQP